MVSYSVSAFALDKKIGVGMKEQMCIRDRSYVLGSSTVGFLLFGVLDGKMRERAKKAGSAGAGVLAAVCLWGIQVHQSYGSTLAAGLILYVLLGIAGSLVHYRVACRYGMEEHLACKRSRCEVPCHSSGKHHTFRVQ